MRGLTKREIILVGIALWLIVIYLGSSMLKDISEVTSNEVYWAEGWEADYQDNIKRIGPVLSEMEMEERLLSMLETCQIKPESSVVSNDIKQEGALSVGQVSITGTGTVENMAALLDLIAATTDMRVTYYSIDNTHETISFELAVQFFMFNERLNGNRDSLH